MSVYDGKSTTPEEIYDAIVNGGTDVYLSAGSWRNKEEASTNETEPSLEAIAVANALMNPSTQVGVLSLRANNIGDFSAAEIAKALKTNTTLTFLELNYNKIGHDGATAIAKALETNTTLEKLHLKYNRIGNDGATAIAKGLETNTTLKDLFLRDNNIGDDGATAIAKELETNTKLRTLDLRSNDIGDTGTAAIAKVFETNRSTKLNVLSLADNRIGDNGAAEIAKALQEKTTTLRSLSLSKNEIKDTGTVAIAKALETNTKLEVLSLRYNSIGDNGAAVIAKALEKTTTLRTLSLSQNEIKDTGTVAVARALGMNTPLEKLYLGGNDDIGDNGVEAISKALETNTSLEILDVSYSKIGDTGAAAIAKALETNTSLKYLDVSNSTIGDTGAATIAKALETKNTSLEILYLVGCRYISDDNTAKIRGLVAATYDYDYGAKDEFERIRQQHKWYNQALLDGRERPRRIRLMMSGPYGVGKTSLVRSLQGKPFISKYESTVGIDAVGRVDKSTVDGEEIDFSRAFWDWRAGQPASDKEDSTRPLKKRRVLGHYPGASLFKRGEAAAETPVRPVSQSNNEHGSNKKLCITVWDFAGQIRYHDMHQMFFRKDCLYVLVLDLRYDKDRQIPVQSEENMLNDAFRWLNAIVSSTGPNIQLLIVGTHASSVDSIEKAEERLQLFVEVLEERSENHPEKEELIANATCVVVDNKDGYGITALHQRLLEDAESLILNHKGQIPLRWLRLMEAITDELMLEEGVFCVKQESIVELAFTMGFFEIGEVVQALVYFDQIGEIIYIQEKEDSLDEWIFPRPQMLLNLMGSLIESPRSARKRPPGLRLSEFKELQSHGFLSSDALSKMWTSLGYRNQNQLRRILTKSGLLMDLGHGVVIPIRLPNHKESHWSPCERECFISIETFCTTHLPPSVPGFVLARLHEAFGRSSQALHLLAKTSSLLRLDPFKLFETNEYICVHLRVLVAFDLDRHSIKMLVGAAPSGATEDNLAEECVVGACKILLRWIRVCLKERYEWMEQRCTLTDATPKEGCCGKTHTWTVPQYSKDDRDVQWTYTCDHAIDHTVKDSIQRHYTTVQTTIPKSGATHQRVEAFTKVKGRVFLSHTGQDSDARGFTPHLWERLSDDGLIAFYDVRSIEASTDWRQSIEENVRNCDVFVCLYSATYCFRFWCMYELDLAIQTNRIVLSVFLDGATPPKSTETSTRKEFFSHFQQENIEKERQMNSEQLERWVSNLSYLESRQAIRFSLSMDNNAPKDAELTLKDMLSDKIQRLLANSSIHS